MRVTYIDHCGSDLSVVNAARVSFNKESDWDWECTNTHDLCYGGAGGSCPYCKSGTLDKGDQRLIKYLAKHKHHSPFNHSFLTCHVKAPIFVARQLVKHKFLVWNEVSRRYVEDEPEFYWPAKWRGKAKDKKQGSEGTIKLTEWNTYGEKYSGWFGEGELGEEIFENLEIVCIFTEL